MSIYDNFFFDLMFLRRALLFGWFYEDFDSLTRAHIVAKKKSWMLHFDDCCNELQNGWRSYYVLITAIWFGGGKCR